MSSLVKSGGTTETQIAIKWGEIAIPDGLNARIDLPEVESLAANLKIRHQLTPIIVMNGGGGDKPYTLIDGARRMAAFKLNGWTQREILAVVRTYAEGNALGPILDSWTANEEREGFATLDKAARVAQLLAGTYYVPAGAVATPIDADAIAVLFGKSKRTIQKLAKVFKNLDADVALKVRRIEAPEWLTIALSQIDGEGETKEAKEADRAQQQMQTLTEWHDARLEFEKLGRQRAPKGEAVADRSKNGKGKKGGKKKPISDNNGWGAIAYARPLDKKERTAVQYFEILGKKAEAKLPKDEAKLVEGALVMMKFLAGERKSLPFLSEQDWKDLLPPPAKEEEEKEDEEIEET